jgi:5-oxopent-3-ene-1,2,5-tricarboxylate decarboxylase/2-hydroxyhepta-2,4-diene-1,7-dioate isomerase
MRASLFVHKRSPYSPRIGLWVAEGLVDFSEAWTQYLSFERSARRFPLQSWKEFLIFSRDISEEIARGIAFLRAEGMLIQYFVMQEEITILAPVERTAKIICLGRNYAQHAREMGHEVPQEPMYFMKSPSSILDPEAPIVYKQFLTRVDPEAELAVIMRRRARAVSRDQAMEYVAGFTALNDVTARDIQRADVAKAHPWFRSKSLDTFCPIGPAIITPEQCGDDIELDVICRVNGETRQKDNTRNMIFSVPQIIEAVTRFITLDVGDVIATGTPEGIAPVKPGDVIEVEVEKIGVLRNPVVSEPSGDPDPSGAESLAEEHE